MLRAHSAFITCNSATFTLYMRLCTCKFFCKISVVHFLVLWSASLDLLASVISCRIEVLQKWDTHFAYQVIFIGSCEVSVVLGCACKQVVFFSNEAPSLLALQIYCNTLLFLCRLQAWEQCCNTSFLDCDWVTFKKLSANMNDLEQKKRMSFNNPCLSFFVRICHSTICSI